MSWIILLQKGLLLRNRPRSLSPVLTFLIFSPPSVFMGAGEKSGALQLLLSALSLFLALDAGQFPSLHCVLDGEKEVMCSWEVSREQAHFITHQLACRRNQTAP